MLAKSHSATKYKKELTWSYCCVYIRRLVELWSSSYARHMPHKCCQNVCLTVRGPLLGEKGVHLLLFRSTARISWNGLWSCICTRRQHIPSGPGLVWTERIVWMGCQEDRAINTPLSMFHFECLGLLSVPLKIWDTITTLNTLNAETNKSKQSLLRRGAQIITEKQSKHKYINMCERERALICTIEELSSWWIFNGEWCWSVSLLNKRGRDWGRECERETKWNRKT